MREALAVAASILAILATIPYIKDIIRGRTKPNVVSWLTWTLLLLIGTAAAFAAHQPRTALLTLGDLIGTGLTLLLGLRFGTARFTWFDGFCLAAIIAALLLWAVFDSPLIAIIAVVIVDFIALVPTLHHSWHTPQEETWQTFAVLIIASVLTLVSLTSFSTASLSYPIYLLLANIAVASTVIFQRHKRGIGLTQTGKSESVHG